MASKKTLFVLALYKALESNKPGDYVIAGSVLGLTTLVKSTPILFPVFLFAYLLFVKRRDVAAKSVLTHIAAMVIAMFVILSPWIVRNYSVTGKFVATMTVSGVAVSQGLRVCKDLSAENDIRKIVRKAAKQQAKWAEEQGLMFKPGFFQYFYSTADFVHCST